MNILIKSARIIDKSNIYNNSVVDILIEDGIISKISDSISNTNNYKELQLDNLHVSQGWIDSSVSFGEPGYEERETIENGLKTASYSGFTDVVLNSDNVPVSDNKANIQALKSYALKSATKIHPLGALTSGYNGKDLAELFEMSSFGAVGFYDYKQPIKNPNLLKIALQYTERFNGIVFSYPLEKQISPEGSVNEHINSTNLGLKGIPNFAESIQISRDLFVLEYAGGHLHIPCVSTKESVALIKAAKAKGLNVTCSTAVHNLVLTDDVLLDFNTHYKVQPPLRTQEDCDALKEGLINGTIDTVTSDHRPLNIELKNVEFEQAEYGTIGLESIFGALQTIFTTEQSIDFLTRGKHIFSIETTEIKEGNVANLTLFNPNTSYTFLKNQIISSSKNSLFLGEKLKGETYGVISNNNIVVKS